MKPKRKVIIILPVAAGVTADKMGMMILSGKRRALVCAAAVVLYIAAAGAFLLVLPHPLAALQLMVAGAFATALALIAAFVLCALCRVNPGALARTVRKSAQSS